MQIKDLKCELQSNPTGIINARPGFSWTFVGDDISPEQGGFRIMMATSIEKLKYPDIWDTGPTSKSGTGPYTYLGEPLKSGQKVYWIVTVWGNNRGVAHSEPAWFEMGDLPKYHSDQTGSFEIVRKEDGTNCLKQICPEQGYDWMRVYRQSNITTVLMVLHGIRSKFSLKGWKLKLL